MQTGEVIKFLRKNFNMTQDELAIKLQVNKSSVQKYESGAVSNLKMDTIRDLCRLFSVPPWVFVFPEHITSEEVLGYVAGSKHAEDSSIFLNKEGIQKAIEYVRDLSEIERYRAKSR